MEQTIYQKLLAIGADMTNHASDLYVVITPAVTEIVRNYKHKESVKSFTSKTDGKHNYEIPFAYDPWWKEKEATVGQWAQSTTGKE